MIPADPDDKVVRSFTANSFPFVDDDTGEEVSEDVRGGCALAYRVV